nr:bifunctional DNA-formamidopyrimidine glycosylase/DNA-(apurinic or apyrimidinic site) lyase [Microbacterium amylolyticum]
MAPAIVGATIRAVEVRDERALTRHVPRDGLLAEDFERRLVGRGLSAAVRRGKFLWFSLGDNEAIIAHLGMSGQMLLRVPGAATERHERIRFTIEHPMHGELAVVFADQRTFGSLAIDRLVPTPDGAAGGFGAPEAVVALQAAHIARDPLDPAFDDGAFVRNLQKRSSAVKRLLLDQTIVSGIGNIYADETLWAARVHPEAPGARLSTRAGARILDEVRSVLDKALAEGGTSFDAQYVNVNGQAGYFAHSLNAYGRGGQPCPRCATPIVRVAFTNRSSHFCRRCQRRR